jgi:hypothetical protein
MKKIARLLCALCVSGPLALEAGAAQSPAQNGASAAAADAGQAALGTTPRGATSIGAGRPVGGDSTPVGSSKGRVGSSKGQVGSSKGQVGSIKGDQSPRRNSAAAVSPRRGSVSPPHAAGPLVRSNADRLRSLHATKARNPTAPLANRRSGPTAAASGNVLARGRGLSGPGLLGGPATARTANRTAIDGATIRRKY